MQEFTQVDKKAIRYFGRYPSATEFLKRFRDEDLAKKEHWKKKSDTLFILGSGTSVNDFGEKEWGLVGQCDSVGMNFWALHPFVPDFYFYEPRDIHFQFFKRLLDQKVEDYRDTPIFINAAHLLGFYRPDLDVLPFNARVYVPTILHFASRKLANLIAISSAARCKLGGCFFGSLLHWTGSLSLPLCAGLALGYKKIVLVGVDLNGEGYFFDRYEDDASQEFLLLQRELHRVENAMAKDKGVHITADPSKKFPMPDVIERTLKTWNWGNASEIFVSSERSKLSAIFPVFKFEDIRI